MHFRFVMSETWSGLKRNGTMVISVLLVTFISFLFIGASALLQQQAVKAKGDWYDKVEVVVWLCPDGKSQSANCAAGTAATTEQINNLQQVISNELAQEVSQVTYVSKQQFYQDQFLKQYPDGVYQGRTLTADDMQDSLWLKLSDPSKYEVVSEVLSGRDGVEEVVDERQIFEPVFAVLNRATMVSMTLALVMVVVAIMLTSMTIRMSAQSRREEVEIMRFVGASNWTIRLPFVLEGVCAALLGSVLSCVALGVIVRVFVTNWLSQSITWMPFVGVREVLELSPALIVGAVLLSAISSSISLRRYLRV